MDCVCFAAYYTGSIDELSGRTTGQLGYDMPDSAYAIGGTVELAAWHYDTPTSLHIQRQDQGTDQ